MKLSIVAALSFVCTTHAFVPTTPLHKTVRTNNVSLEMTKITAAMVKELRARTAAGMMECKKALSESNGDISLAVENMRKSGAVKAAKKAGRVAADGLITVKSSGNTALLLEVNCQTDFVAKDGSFKDFCDEVATAALAGKKSTEELQAEFEEKRVALVAKIGENVIIRRAELVESEDIVGTYLHGKTIGVIVTGSGEEEDLRKVCLHVAAANPEYMSSDDVPADVIEKEKAVQIEIAMNQGKPAAIAEKMVTGRMKKFTSEISLVDQPFVMEQKMSVGQWLKSQNSSVLSFKRMQLGEGIEKEEEMSFAEEVAAAQG